MLNISGLNNGVVIDHIKAGAALDIYSYLGLEKYEGSVAIIKNAKSNKMGKKDIIKIEGIPENMDLDILAIISDSITINIIEGGVIKQKKVPALPDEVSGILKCKNPRCITGTEQELPHVFRLTNKEKRAYRCIYCEELFTWK